MDGIGWFTCESLNIMTRRNPEHEFIFVFDRQPHPSFRFGNNVQLVTVPPQARHPFLYILWFELSLPYMIRKHKPDLLLSPDGFLPVLSRIPSLAVIHDLNFEHNPEDLPWLTRNYYRCFFPHFARKATRIATVSGFSKDDITQTYGIDPAKIDVVYNGASNGFKPADPSVVLETRHFYTRGLPYFLFVGTLHPRKNLENLFLAFDHFRSCHPEPFCLLIVGNRKWWTPGIEETYRKMKFRNDVIFTGRLTPERLHLVTASAFAVTYVSFFEGFGIPLL